MFHVDAGNIGIVEMTAEDMDANRAEVFVDIQPNLVLITYLSFRK